MSSFVKLYAEILDSSVWLESQETRLVWITMLVMKDADGNVWASVNGLARRAGVSREGCQRALETLLAPDPDTRDGTTGERITKIDGGWHVINHDRYAQKRTRRQVQVAAAVKRHREKKSRMLSEEG